MKWDNEADIQLLVILLHRMPGPIPWADIAECMGQGCTVSALKHRVDRLKKKVNIPESKVRASPSISPRKSTTTTPTKGRRASVMKATKFKRSPKKANNLASESETSEPESPKLEPDSESDDEENDDLLKEEDSDLILVKEEDPAVSKEKDKDVTADTEEEEEY